jgi:5-methylthioadenosine/S-adenosylhomocysteine deaminase
MTHTLLGQSIDQIIDARWIIPIEPAGLVLENHSLAIHGNQIIDLLPTTEANTRYHPTRHFKLSQHALLPGLINLHTHAAMTLLRGFADDLPLMRWLQEHIWPAEGRHVSPDFVYDGTLLACWEMLRSGITCFNDMYFFPAAAAQAAQSAGIRAALGITVFEFPSAYGTNAEDYLQKGMAVRTSHADNPLINFCLAPHAPYTVADRTFERIAALSAQENLPVHVHLHETQDEIAESLKNHGCRPLERIQRLGLVNEKLIAVHTVHLEASEIALLAENHCHAAHCPSSNMKLASGISPITTMAAKGIGIGLGTDGAASNNRLDIFQEMRQAALLAKVQSQDAASLPAHMALEMATIQGARALGLDQRVGSLQIGKEADLLAVKLDDWIYQPCFDPVSHLVYTVGREAVSHVWVAGKLRIDDKFPTDLDKPALLHKLELWQNTLANKA